MSATVLQLSNLFDRLPPEKREIAKRFTEETIEQLKSMGATTLEIQIANGIAIGLGVSNAESAKLNAPQAQSTARRLGRYTSFLMLRSIQLNDEVNPEQPEAPAQEAKPTCGCAACSENRIIAVRAQKWRRAGDEAATSPGGQLEVDGVNLARRFVNMGLYPSEAVAFIAMFSMKVGDTHNTGVSAWQRIA